MDSSRFESSLKVYFEAFAENDKPRRLVLLSRCMTEAGEIWGPQRLFKGYEAISEKIEGFHSRMPGARLVLASGLNTFLNIAHFKVAIINGDGSTRAVGDNFIEMAECGRIVRVFPFWEAVPPSSCLVATPPCFVDFAYHGAECGLTNQEAHECDRASPVRHRRTIAVVIGADERNLA